MWRSALRRFDSRVRRYDIYVDRLALRRDSKGDAPQQLVHHNDLLYLCSTRFLAMWDQDSLPPVTTPLKRSLTVLHSDCLV